MSIRGWRPLHTHRLRPIYVAVVKQVKVSASLLYVLEQVCVCVREGAQLT